MKVAFKKLFSILALLLCVCHQAYAEDRYSQDKVVKSFSELKQLVNQAKQGDPKAQYELALFYRDGYLDGTVDDYLGNLKASSDKGNRDAMYELGNAYFFGTNGVKEDKQLGAYWWDSSARLKHPIAVYNIGSLYLQGDVYTQDIEKAVEHYEKSWALGYVEAAAMIGGLYLNGEYKKRDLGRSLHYFCMAAMKNDEKSQEILGHFYFGEIENNLVKRNTEYAFFWYLSSVANGQHRSSKKIAEYYSEGIDPIKKIMF